MKHKHYDIIVAWAEGKKIEVFNDRRMCWEDITGDPYWVDSFQYRIKPKPTLDVVKDFYLESNPLLGLRFSQAHTPIDLRGREFGCIRCTFDGETQRLKSVEVL
jgi:hypothetical protein